MKKSELILLYNGLNSVGNLTGVTFSYSVNKNLAKMKSEIDALQKAGSPSKEFLEYDQKRVEVVKNHAKRDDKGELILEKNPVTQQDQYAVDDIVAVEKEVDILRAEYKDVLDARNKQVDEYNALLEEESNVELYKVKLENVPKDITADQMKGIYPIIEE